MSADGSRRRSNLIVALIFLLPTLLILGALVVYPIISTVILIPLSWIPWTSALGQRK